MIAALIVLALSPHSLLLMERTAVVDAHRQHARIVRERRHHLRRIMEDDSRWDCRHMGNRICGTGAR